MLHTLARHWWALAVRGVVAVLFGLLAFLVPGITLVTFVLLFGAYAMMDGTSMSLHSSALHRIIGRC